MGEQKVADCEKHFSETICNYLNIIWDNAYLIGFLQDHVAPIGYLRDHSNAHNYLEYLQYNNYLKYINNEVEHDMKAQYKQRFSGLNRLMVADFSADTTIIPKESSIFSDYTTATGV